MAPFCRPRVLFFFGAVQSRAKWQVRPQLKQMLLELDAVFSGTGKHITGGGGGRAFRAACWCVH
jgi:hypothetical protein